MVSKLGEMLVKAQLITDTQLDEVIKIQRREGGKLGSIVVRAGFCSDQDIVSFLGMQYGVPAADLEQWPPIEPSIIALIPKDLAQRHKVLPLQRTGNVLTLAMSDPTDIFAMDDVRFHTGYNVDPRRLQRDGSRPGGGKVLWRSQRRAFGRRLPGPQREPDPRRHPEPQRHADQQWSPRSQRALGE